MAQNDLDLIKQLEKAVGRKLSRIDFNKITGYGIPGFAVDRGKQDEVRVIGINLSSKELKAIPPVLARFQHLEKLDLSVNKIGDLSPLTGLTNLTVLNLDNNQVIDLSPLTGLTNLTTLFFGENQVIDLSPLTGLSRLQDVDAIDNKITALPPAILDLKPELDVEGNWFPDENKIFLKGNPLQLPPEIIKKGKAAMRVYFESLEKEKELPLQEVKVLLVGDGGAGKTSLVKQVLGKDFDPKENQTHGINIEPWQIKFEDDEITVHLWDFGGQEIMHATHQFFLSKRSLYILVLDGRKDEKAEYWLKLIESFGGDSPVLAVLNKIDQNPGFDVNRKFLQQKYKNIKGFFPLSCDSGEGVEAFRAALKEELPQVEMLQTSWPESWFRVKQRLEKMSEHYINLPDYEKICSEEHVTGKITCETLLELLNDLGVALYFKDFYLRDTQVLEPEWVTGAVYKIINAPLLAEKQGALELDMLGHILNPQKSGDYEYPPDKYRYITGLMEKFEICYPLDRGSRVLVPDLLPVPEPDFAFDYDTALRFIVEYDFLPRSVMPRFIVNMYRDIENSLQWRTGVVLHDPEYAARAMVRADHEARRIYIYVTGGQKRDYFAVVLGTLRRINRSFEKLKVKELVPMPDDPATAASYKQLVQYEQKGIDIYMSGESDKEYRVKDLLGTIADNRTITEEELLRYLKKIADEKDTKESLNQKLHDNFVFQPNVFGIGFNVNNMIDKVLALINKKKKGK